MTVKYTRGGSWQEPRLPLALKICESIEWDKIFAIHVSDKELLSILYKELLQINKEKAGDLIKQNEQNIWIGTSLRGCLSSQDSYVKMLHLWEMQHKNPVSGENVE